MKKVNKDHAIIWKLVSPVAKSIKMTYADSNESGPPLSKDLEAAGAGGGPTTKVGGTKSKTKAKIYKKLLNRERTLKRRIFSN